MQDAWQEAIVLPPLPSPPFLSLFFFLFSLISPSGSGFNVTGCDFNTCKNCVNPNHVHLMNVTFCSCNSGYILDGTDFASCIGINMLASMCWWIAAETKLHTSVVIGNYSWLTNISTSSLGYHKMADCLLTSYTWYYLILPILLSILHGNTVFPYG